VDGQSHFGVWKAKFENCMEKFGGILWNVEHEIKYKPVSLT
jgi:hypothetical protein